MTDLLASYRQIEPDSALCAPRPVELATDTIVILMRRAMKCLQSDCRDALRCLNDASTLLDGYVKQSEDTAPELPSDFQAGGLMRWQARRALAHIEENLASKIAVWELAALVSLSDSHFTRAFKRSLGLTPMAYVARRRVEQAKFMMTSTAKQLTEIALVCGYADQSHFTRSFRRLVGISPSLWRRTNAISQLVIERLSHRRLRVADPRIVARRSRSAFSADQSRSVQLRPNAPPNRPYI